MIKKVAFSFYPVIDMKRAREFYENILGFKPGSTGGDKWVEYDLPGGGCFALTTMTGAKPSADAGGCVAFEVDDIDATVTELKAKNIEVKMEIIDTPVCRMAAILDSEGNGILLHQINKK